jgi:hypothetical protein
MKINLAKSIWAHKLMVDRQTSSFSTTKIDSDQYSKYYDTHLYQKPHETEAERKYKLLRMQQKKEKDKQSRIKNQKAL